MSWLYLNEILLILSLTELSLLLFSVLTVFAIRRKPEKTFLHLSCPITVVIPVVGFPETLKSSVDSVRLNSQLNVDIIIVHQSIVSDDICKLKSWSEAFANLKLLSIDGVHSKAHAVKAGLAECKNDLVLLLDSDTRLSPTAISTLAAYAVGADAVFGIVASSAVAGPKLLNEVVNLEKLVSHSLWRPGRWALNLGPNLPGQCYLIRKDVIAEYYSASIGLLDDVSLTVRLLADGRRISFCPHLVARESGRNSWIGFILQRTRYTYGYLQAFRGVNLFRPKGLHSLVCVLIHGWLYYVACIVSSAVLVSALVMGQFSIFSACATVFFVSRMLISILATANLRRLGIDDCAFRPSKLLPVAVFILPLSKLLGLLFFWAIPLVTFLRVPLFKLYKR